MNYRRGCIVVTREKVAPRAYETARNRHCGVETRSWVSVKVNNTLIMEIRYWVTHDSGQEIMPIGWSSEQELCRLIARTKKFWPIYRGFNQGNTERFWYSCVIVSWLRTWFTIWNPTEDFTKLMYDLCDEMEKRGIWNPKAGGAVHEIGDAFVTYMNNRFPDKKVWKSKVAYWSSAMWGCLVRNIPIVTAYIHSKEYWIAQSDWEITAEETKKIQYGQYGHCITMTGLWPLWHWIEFQDNYERFWAWNTYKTFFFNRVYDKCWYKGCLWILLPVDMQPVAIKERAKLANI